MVVGGGSESPAAAAHLCGCRPAPPLVQMAIVLARGAPFAKAGTEAVPGRMRHAAQRLGG